MDMTVVQGSLHIKKPYFFSLFSAKVNKFDCDATFACL